MLKNLLKKFVGFELFTTNELSNPKFELAPPKPKIEPA
jgi:hypothetical protein